MAPPHTDLTLDDLLAGDLLSCVFQPLIDVDTGVAVAHEALLRGPAGSRWESPMALLQAAGEQDVLLDLECASLRASLRDVAFLASARPVTLCVNLEPSTLTRHPEVVLAILASRAPGVQVIVEITERALAADPAGILAGAERLRAAGCGIALDDVGVEPESLAFIPLLGPEVVKLDLGLLRSLDDPTTVMVAGAVRAYAEASGAEVVAEGVETAEDVTRARVLGATLGQGWWWGKPGRFLSESASQPERFQAHPVGPLLGATPYDLLTASRSTRRAPKRLLLPLSQTLEVAAMQARVPPMLLACFQKAQHFSPATALRYTALGDRLPFVCVLGEDMSAVPAPNVRGAALHRDDPLTLEWTVVILGAHESAALIARDCGDTGVDSEREFEFVVTHDRGLVTSVAHALVGRLPAG